MRKFPEPSSYWSEVDGRRAVEAWQQSGEDATAFSRRHRMHRGRLLYWRKRLAARASAPALSFAPAEVVERAEEVAAVIRAPGGIAVGSRAQRRHRSLRSRAR
jgi:hypothetical protein